MASPVRTDFASLEARVAAYIAELQGPIPYFSTSHGTLSRLWRDFGQPAVDAELEKHWAAERARAAEIERAKVRAFYASYGITID